MPSSANLTPSPTNRQTVGQQRASAASTAQTAAPPPNDVYTLMAAAQMAGEGRLFKAPTGGVSDKLDSISPADAAPLRR